MPVDALSTFPSTSAAHPVSDTPSIPDIAPDASRYKQTDDPVRGCDRYGWHGMHTPLAQVNPRSLHNHSGSVTSCRVLWMRHREDYRPAALEPWSESRTPWRWNTFEKGAGKVVCLQACDCGTVMAAMVRRRLSRCRAGKKWLLRWGTPEESRADGLCDGTEGEARCVALHDGETPSSRPWHCGCCAQRRQWRRVVRRSSAAIAAQLGVLSSAGPAQTQRSSIPTGWSQRRAGGAHTFWRCALACCDSTSSPSNQVRTQRGGCAIDLLVEKCADGD